MLTIIVRISRGERDDAGRYRAWTEFLHRAHWKYTWAPTLSVTAFLLSAVVLLNFVRNAPGYSQEIMITEMRAKATPKQLKAALDAWADKTGYQTSRSRTFQYGLGQTGRLVEVRQAQFFAPSPFDRHRFSGRRLVRPLPTLNVTCVSISDPPESFVSVDSGAFIVGTREETDWQALLHGLESALMHSTSPSTGGND